MNFSISAITLFQFKNYAEASFRFGERVTGICGENGRGKTNLLDAIHFLCMTRSYFARHDAHCVQEGAEGFRITGRFDRRGTKEEAVCILRPNGKKEFRIDDDAYPRLSAHMGRYPCVVIAPDDVQLLLGGSEDRRRFLDMLLCQIDPDYLAALVGYTRVLQQRNAFLKSHLATGRADWAVLDALDAQLIHEGEKLYRKRSVFLEPFLARVAGRYAAISGGNEAPELSYASDGTADSFAERLQTFSSRDAMAGRSTVGPHRDDLGFELGGEAFRYRASQGQRKSLLFALKLGAYDALLEALTLPPLLLLDDVFEKLDDQRILNLLRSVIHDSHSQVFVTDTSCQRLEDSFRKLEVPYHLERIV